MPDKTTEIETPKDSTATQDKVRDNAHLQSVHSVEVRLLGNK